MSRMFLLILLDADCSGRMLATILVAWVTTAMVASILLQWQHMWIVLAILTLLFLLVCGYTAYTVNRTQARILIEQQRAAIRTVPDIAADRRQTGSLAFAVRSIPVIPDPPPSYASVMTVRGPSTPGTIDLPSENKFEDPPPYSIVIASMNVQERDAEVSSEQHVPPAASMKKDDAVASATSGLDSVVTHVPACPK